MTHIAHLTETLETARQMQSDINAATRNAGRMIVPTASSAVDVDPAFLAKLTTLRQTLAPDLTDAELELFALIAQRRGLDPFSGQITAVKRNTKRGPRVSYQTGIDGYRSIAERTGEYRGSDEPEFGPACGCGKAPAGHPEWARVVVHRRIGEGDYIHQPGRAKWDEYVPSDSFIWTDKPEIMLSKCAEAQALRKAFPWMLSDIYVPEEMARSGEDEGGPPPKIVSARESVAAQAAALRETNTGTQFTTTTNPGSAATTITVHDDGSADAEDDEPDDAAVPRDPRPDAGGPGATAVAIVPMTAQEFMAKTSSMGIPSARVREKAAEVFGDQPASSLTPMQWGELFAHLTGG